MLNKTESSVFSLLRARGISLRPTALVAGKYSYLAMRWSFNLARLGHQDSNMHSDLRGDYLAGLMGMIIKLKLKNLV